MKFPITTEQYEAIQYINLQAEASKKTLQVAIDHHESKARELITLDNGIWSQIVTENDLDMNNHSWEIRMISGVPYVITTGE